MDYWIRLATKLDAGAINRLCVEAYQEYEAAVGRENWEQMQKLLSQAADLSAIGDLFVAEDEGGVLGMVLYLPPGKSDGVSIPKEWATMRTLAVAPQSRGRGVGKRLTEYCIERAAADGATAIGLTTSEMMRIALPMYERMGFQREEELEPRFGAKQARYVLRLPLAESPGTTAEAAT